MTTVRPASLGIADPTARVMSAPAAAEAGRTGGTDAARSGPVRNSPVNREDRYAVRVVASEADFDDAEAQWNSLLERSDATIFQTFEWQRTWWKYFGGDRDLLLLFIERDGTVEGIAPMFRSRERLLGIPITIRIQFIGVGLSDYLSVIAARGREIAVLGALADWLSIHRKSWDVFDLEDVPETSLSFLELPRLLEARGLPIYRYHGTVCPRVILPETEVDLMSQLGPSSSYNLRRKWKKLRTQHAYAVRLVRRPEDPIDRAVADFARIHGGRWKSQGHPSAFDDPHHVAFHAEICRRTASRDWLRFHFLDVDGVAVGVCFSFNYRSTIYMYQSNAHSSDEVMRCSPGLIVRSIAMTDGIGEGMRVFDFMRGNEAYKYREWSAVDLKNWLLRSSPPSLAGRMRFWLFLASELLEKAAGRIRRECYEYRRYRLTGQDQTIPLPEYIMQRLELIFGKTVGYAARHLGTGEQGGTRDVSGIER